MPYALPTSKALDCTLRVFVCSSSPSVVACSHNVSTASRRPGIFIIPFSGTRVSAVDRCTDNQGSAPSGTTNRPRLEITKRDPAPVPLSEGKRILRRHEMRMHPSSVSTDSEKDAAEKV